MKLKLIALSTLMALSSIANAAPQTGEAYVGAKAGWATGRDGLTQLWNKSQLCYLWSLWWLSILKCWQLWFSRRSWL